MPRASAGSLTLHLISHILYHAIQPIHQVVQDKGLSNIQKAKAFVQANMGIEDPSLLSDDFYFLGACFEYVDMDGCAKAAWVRAIIIWDGCGWMMGSFSG